ncbi:AP-5 complex subunit mu-like [Tripterygium wilfordii]|uniref:AP-5 complex subunit mu-like n=1 Tax=Tripterygium wilfordii TaxID=458696 RepID=UPI0018F84038|nr:AP-5 complex subunit mu-like [Tripterygium wilfordii]
MPSGCSIRALWILDNNLDAVVFSRRFPVVEKRWRTACDSERSLLGTTSYGIHWGSALLQPQQYHRGDGSLGTSKIVIPRGKMLQLAG